MGRTGVLALGVLAMLLLACTTWAQDDPGATDPGTQAPDPPSPASTSPPGPPAAPGLGEPAAVTAGIVTVTLDRDAFLAGAPITGLVANGLDVPVYLEDMQSDCSIVTLERQEGEQWRAAGECAMERLPRVVAIGPGRGRAFTLNPGSVHFFSDPVGPGAYRIMAPYRFTAEPGGDAPAAAGSMPFTVR